MGYHPQPHGLRHASSVRAAVATLFVLGALLGPVSPVGAVTVADPATDATGKAASTTGTAGGAPTPPAGTTAGTPPAADPAATPPAADAAAADAAAAEQAAAAQAEAAQREAAAQQAAAAQAAAKANGVVVQEPDDGLPSWIWAAVAGGILLAAALAWGLVVASGRFERLAPISHALGEAGWRLSARWAEFTDWLRLGSGR